MLHYKTICIVFFLVLILLCFIMVLFYKYLQKFKQNKNVCKSAVISTKSVESVKKKPKQINLNKQHLNVFSTGIDILDQYLHNVKINRDENSVIDIIKLYIFGIHGNLPSNKLVAGHLCNFIATSPLFSDNAKIIASDLQGEIHYEGPSSFFSNIQLPDNIIEILNEIFLPQSFNIQCSVINIRKKQSENPPPDNFTFFDINNVNVDEQEAILQQIFAYNNPTALSDSQNVHSTSVQNSANKVINTLETRNPTVFSQSSAHLNIEECIRDINKNKTLSNNDKVNAIKVANSFSDNQHSRYNKSEKEIFNIMYAAIQSISDSNDKNNALVLLYQSMASAVENDLIVCSTGKIVRMISCLEGLNLDISKDLPQLKTEEYIDTDLANLAAKTKHNILEKYPRDLQLAYEHNGQENIEKEMVSSFRDAAIARYEGIVSNTTLDAKIKTIIKGF